MSTLKYWDNVAGEWRYVTVPMAGQPVEHHFDNFSRGTTGTDADLVEMGRRTIPNPGAEVVVSAIFTGRVALGPATAPVQVSARVQISTDGGATWLNFEPSVVATSDQTEDEGAPLAAQGFFSGTPTGDVVVRVMTQRVLGSSGAASFRGDLSVDMSHGSPVVLDNRYARHGEIALNTHNVSAPLTSYPFGASYMPVSDAALGWPTQFGLVTTVRSSEDYNRQVFSQMQGSEVVLYERRWITSSASWAPWQGMSREWTPSFFGTGATLNSANWSVGRATYQLAGDVCHWQCEIQNVTGTAGDTAAWGFSLPITPVGVAHLPVGTGLRRSGGNRRACHVYQDGNSDRTMVYYSDLSDTFMTAAEQGNGWWMMFHGSYRIR